MKTWIRAAISLGLLAVLFWILPWHEARQAVTRMPFGVWLAVLAAWLAGHRLSVVKWRRLVNLGRAGLGARDAVRCYAAGLFANLCLPSIVGGDVLRATLAARATGRAEATVLGSIADRLIDTAVLAALVVVGAFLSRDALPGWGGTIAAVGSLIAVIGALSALPLVLRRPLARWPRKLRRPIGRGLVALRYVGRTPAPAILALAISIVVQSAFVMLNVWIGRSIGIAVPLAVWFYAWPLAKIAGLIPVSLGGLAVRDATFGALLAPVGVPMAVGVIASLIWQSVLIAGGLAGGAVWWIMSRGLKLRWSELPGRSASANTDRAGTVA